MGAAWYSACPISLVDVNRKANSQLDLGGECARGQAPICHAWCVWCSRQGTFGDETEWSQRARMFREHHQTVWRTLRRWGLDAQEAADAGQQTYVIAAERLGDIKAGCEHAFLIGTALRIAQANHRKTKRLQLEEDMDLRFAERACSTSDKLSDIELIDLALARMEPPLVEVFVLYELEGLPSPEIAKALNLALRVEALTDAGDSATAHALARSFLKAHPSSPLAERVEQLAGPSR